jgi:hypothetical protein
MSDAKSNPNSGYDLAKRRMITLPEVERMEQLLKDSILIFNSGKFEKNINTAL